jgi:hypothetical protein
MKLSSKLLLAALGAASLMAGASGASADTRWQDHHGRRVEVNHRLANQNRRITREVRDGQISHRQAHDLRAEDRGIRGQERFYASRHGGHITRAEQRHLNREENGVSRQIGR